MKSKITITDIAKEAGVSASSVSRVINNRPGVNAETRQLILKLMEKYNAVIWAHHGMFCSGEDFDLTFGLMHTVEKSAEILVKMLSMRPDKRQTISPQNFRDLAKDFKVTLPEKFLYDK